MEAELNKIVFAIFVIGTITLLWIKSRSLFWNEKLESQLSFLRKIIKKPPCDYKIPYEIIDSLRNGNYDPASIRMLVKSILSHMKINEEGINIIIHYENEVQEEHKNKSGFCNEIDKDQWELHMILKPQYSINHLIAIISHEATHHLLREHRYSENILESEELIDVGAVYMGFGKYLYEAYKPIDRIIEERWEENKRIVSRETFILGYLELDEISYVLNRVNEIKLARVLVPSN